MDSEQQNSAAANGITFMVSSSQNEPVNQSRMTSQNLLKSEGKHNTTSQKSLEEIDEQFMRIKERLKKQKEDGTDKQFKQMVQSLNVKSKQDLRQMFAPGGHCKTEESVENMTARQQFYVDAKDQRVFEDKQCLDTPSKDPYVGMSFDDNGRTVKNQFSKAEEIEEQLTGRGPADLSQDYSQMVDQVTLNARASHAFKQSFEPDLNNSIPLEHVESFDDRNVNREEEDEDNILSRSSQKRKRYIMVDDREDSIDQQNDPLSSRSSKKDLALLHENLQQTIKEDDSQKSNKKQFQILSQSEILNLTEVQKQEYITWLKEEIHQEVKRELKFKNLQDDLSLLHKNFALEQELHVSEQENRKLQMWILEDKHEQLSKKLEESKIETQKVNQMVEEARAKVDQVNQLLKKKAQEIEEVKQTLEETQQEHSSVQQNQDETMQEIQSLNNQINLESNKLKEEQELLEVQQSFLEEKNKLINDTQSAFNKVSEQLNNKEIELNAKEKELTNIEEDIQEANFIIEKLDEEKDMYETQGSFLQKQNAIFTKEMDKLIKKKKFDEDYVMYGQKNCQKIREDIHTLKDQTHKLKIEKSQIDRDMYVSKHGLVHAQNQINVVERQINLKYPNTIKTGQENQDPKDLSQQQPQFQTFSKNQQLITVDAGHQTLEGSKSPDVELSEVAHKVSLRDNQFEMMSFHQKAKSIQTSEMLEANQTLNKYVMDQQAQKDINTYRESMTLTHDSNNPIHIQTSGVNSSRPMTNDAMKKFLDNNYQGLKHPKEQECQTTTHFKKLLTLTESQSLSQPSQQDQLETRRTHDEHLLGKTLKEGAPLELKPRDLDDSSLNQRGYQHPPSFNNSNQIGPDTMIKIQQNTYGGADAGRPSSYFEQPKQSISSTQHQSRLSQLASQEQKDQNIAQSRNGTAHNTAKSITVMDQELVYQKQQQFSSIEDSDRDFNINQVKKENDAATNSLADSKEKSYDLPRQSSIKVDYDHLRVNASSLHHRLQSPTSAEQFGPKPKAVKEPATALTRLGGGLNHLGSDKYRSFFSNVRLGEKAAQKLQPSQKTERRAEVNGIGAARQSLMFIKEQEAKGPMEKRTKSTDARSEQGFQPRRKSREQNAREQFLNQEQSINLSKISRKDSEILSNGQRMKLDSERRVLTSLAFDQRKDLRRDSSQNEYGAANQVQKTQQSAIIKRNQSDRSKEREAILKQTQDLIRKSQDRLRWHKSENKNLNKAYQAIDRLKDLDAIKNGADLEHKYTIESGKQHFSSQHLEPTRAKSSNSQSFELKQSQLYAFNDYRSLRGGTKKKTVMDGQSDNGGIGVGVGMQAAQVNNEYEQQQIGGGIQNVTIQENKDWKTILDDSHHHHQSVQSAMVFKNSASTLGLSKPQPTTSTAQLAAQRKLTYGGATVPDNGSCNGQYKSKYRTGDIPTTNANAGKIMAYKDSFHDNQHQLLQGAAGNAGQQQHGHNNVSDVVSQGSIDNILHKKSAYATTTGNASKIPYNRPSRSKDEVQHYSTVTKGRTPSQQSSQFKSRTAMRVLGLHNQTSQTSQYQIQLEDQKMINHQTLDTNNNDGDKDKKSQKSTSPLNAAKLYPKTSKFDQNSQTHHSDLTDFRVTSKYTAPEDTLKNLNKNISQLNKEQQYGAYANQSQSHTSRNILQQQTLPEKNSNLLENKSNLNSLAFGQKRRLSEFIVTQGSGGNPVQGRSMHLMSHTNSVIEQQSHQSTVQHKQLGSESVQLDDKAAAEKKATAGDVSQRKHKFVASGSYQPQQSAIPQGPPGYSRNGNYTQSTNYQVRFESNDMTRKSGGSGHHNATKSVEGRFQRANLFLEQNAQLRQASSKDQPQVPQPSINIQKQNGTGTVQHQGGDSKSPANGNDDAKSSKSYGPPSNYQKLGGSSLSIGASLYKELNAGPGLSVPGYGGRYRNSRQYGAMVGAAAANKTMQDMGGNDQAKSEMVAGLGAAKEGGGLYMSKHHQSQQQFEGLPYHARNNDGGSKLQQQAPSQEATLQFLLTQHSQPEMLTPMLKQPAVSTGASNPDLDYSASTVGVGRQAQALYQQQRQQLARMDAEKKDFDNVGKQHQAVRQSSKSPDDILGFRSKFAQKQFSNDASRMTRNSLAVQVLDQQKTHNTKAYDADLGSSMKSNEYHLKSFDVQYRNYQTSAAANQLLPQHLPTSSQLNPGSAAASHQQEKPRSTSGNHRQQTAAHHTSPLVHDGGENCSNEPQQRQGDVYYHVSQLYSSQASSAAGFKNSYTPQQANSCTTAKYNNSADQKEHGADVSGPMRSEHFNKPLNMHKSIGDLRWDHDVDGKAKAVNAFAHYPGIQQSRQPYQQRLEQQHHNPPASAATSNTVQQNQTKKQNYPTGTTRYSLHQVEPTRDSSHHRQFDSTNERSKAVTASQDASTKMMTEKQVRHISSTSRNMIMTPDQSQPDCGEGGVSPMMSRLMFSNQNKLDDVRETRVNKTYQSYKRDEPDMMNSYASKESKERRRTSGGKNDSIECVQPGGNNVGAKEQYANIFRAMDNQAVMSPNVRKQNLASTSGLAFTPHLHQQQISSFRSTEKSNPENYLIQTQENFKSLQSNLYTFNYNSVMSEKDGGFCQTAGQGIDDEIRQDLLNPKAAETYGSTTADRLPISIVENNKSYNMNVKREDRSKEERGQRHWGQFKSSFAKREMSKDSSQERQNAFKSGGLVQQAAQHPATTAHQMPTSLQNQQYVMDYNAQYQSEPSFNQPQPVHDFPRRQNEDQPKSLHPAAASQHQKGPTFTFSDDQIATPANQYQTLPSNDTPYAETTLAHKQGSGGSQHQPSSKMAEADPKNERRHARKDSKKKKLSQFLVPNVNHQSKIEVSSLANITDQVMTGNIKDYKQQQSKQVLKMQQELQRMHQEAALSAYDIGANAGASAGNQYQQSKANEPRSAVPIGYKRKGSQDYTLDLSMEDKLSEYPCNRKGGGLATPYVIHQNGTKQQQSDQEAGESENPTMTQQALNSGGAIKQEAAASATHFNHVELDSDMHSSIFLQGSGMGSQMRALKDKSEHATGSSVLSPHTQQSKERQRNAMQETTNLSLQEQADIINQLRTTKSQRGKSNNQ